MPLSNQQTSGESAALHQAVTSTNVLFAISCLIG